MSVAGSWYALVIVVDSLRSWNVERDQAVKYGRGLAGSHLYREPSSVFIFVV